MSKLLSKLIQVPSVISEITGKIFRWVVVATIVVLCYEVTSRYLFNSPTLWANDISRMLGLTLYCMGFGYALLHRAHVRIDLIYGRLPSRGRALIDVICTFTLFFPLLAGLLYTSWKSMLFSWSHAEKWITSAWFPPVTPIKIVVVIGLSILALQVVAMFIRDLQLLAGGNRSD